MATFDSSKYDIPTLVAKLRDQRFDGYQPEQLAQVVEKFRDGAGPSGITGAVEALKSISGALADTEEALRTQLKALGVEWQSRAAGQASSVVAREAGFSGEATAKVEQAAQMMYEQAEAFTRTRNKLPAPEDLRKAGGYTFGDTVFSLFGFETDHAADVRTAEEAKAQAVDALNAYAHDSGNYLGSTSTVDAPAPVSLLSAPGTGVVAGIGGASAPVPSLPDTAPTQAQGTKDVTPARVDTPTPPMGVPAAPAAGASLAGVTPAGAGGGTTAGRPAAPAPTGSVAGGSGSPGGAGFAGERRASASPESKNTGGQSGAATGGRAIPSSGSAVGARPGSAGQPGAGQVHGAGGRSAAGAPGTGLGPGVGLGAGTGSGAGAAGGSGAGGGSAATPAEEALGRGRSAGAMPPSTTSPNAVGPGFAAVRTPSGLSGLAEAAPALGAAGASGALAGEGERQSRVGRNTAGNRIHQIPSDDLPEEEEARLARRGGHTPDSATTRSILEPAAPQDGEEDAGHVRRFGVDDNDLFTDRRDVSPDTIGDR
ncbi:PPE domain-containing protein [Amycolatopsis tucumanensis]|uniref:PPE domain-containing protein n=1 Tax=Amycolatopsis tucumanensis TaxID=401106 RepID=A0ABP7I089_9PSEU|nr:PPE domain-containing protein [Amycolatopsis tucumanensis]MCF6421864.1 PPE domain-containing protein [Amycolatopsis tucumanensis]